MGFLHTFAAFSALALVAARARQHAFSPSGQDAAKVDVSLFVMSRCPDARMCESVFEDVMLAEGMYDKIDLHMNYIASLDESEPLGVSCKHGPQECLGNAHQLCLQKHLPLATFYASLACQNFQHFPGDIGEVAFTRRCLEAVKTDWWDSGVGRCVEGKRSKKPKAGHVGKEARKLLRENVAEVLKTNITTSCTIQIGSSRPGSPHICVVDGGVWRGCDEGHTAADFVRIINTEWKRLNDGGDRYID